MERRCILRRNKRKIEALNPINTYFLGCREESGRAPLFFGLPGMGDNYRVQVPNVP